MPDGVDGANVKTQFLDMYDPITETTPEAGFTHVFTTFAIQALHEPDHPEYGAFKRIFRLLKPGGVFAVAIWDKEQEVVLLNTWKLAAQAVDPTYVDPPKVPPGQWAGRSDLEAGTKKVGCIDVHVETVRAGFDIGTEAVLAFLWDSDNPFLTPRLKTYRGDKEKTKEEMRRILKERYNDGWDVPLYAALAVGMKPK